MCIYLSAIFVLGTLRHSAPSITPEFIQRWRKGSVHRLFLNTACNHRQYMVQNVTSFIFMQFMTESRWIHGAFGPQKCFIPIHLKGAKPLLKTGALDRIQITDNLCTTTKCRFTSLLMNLGGTSYTVWYIWLLHSLTLKMPSEHVQKCLLIIKALNSHHISKSFEFSKMFLCLFSLGLKLEGTLTAGLLLKMPCRIGWMDCSVVKESAEWPYPQSCGQQPKVHVHISDKWSPAGVCILMCTV